MRKTATKGRMLMITSIWICSHMISDLTISCDLRSDYLQKSRMKTVQARCSK
jgi:hypothetical protein